MKQVFTTLLLLAQTMILYSQQVKVVSSADLQPVSNCLIYNTSQTKSVTTNTNGIADITQFGKADTLVFKHLAYAKVVLSMNDQSIKNGTVFLADAIFRLDEVVFSANKTEEKPEDLANHIDIIPLKQIQSINPQTTADLLQQTGNVFVQQSQLGGGSPVIRGMESNRVLLVVDGVRLNNAIYRAGHLQNAITLDPNILQRAEVVHGPGSVIYGSDAMGGVMHFYTRNPQLSTTDKVLSTANVMLKYGSAASEKAGNIGFNAGWKKFGVLFSASYKDIGDLKAGSNRDSKYGDWGKCLYYAERINDKDSMVANGDPLVQKYSGYKQYDILLKTLFQPDTKHRLVLNTQFSNSGNISRYDRLTEMSGGKLKYAEWYYGPQTRALVSLRSEWLNPVKAYDNAALTAAWQYISEDRISRSFGKSKRKHQEETVNVLTLNADLMKKIFKSCELRYGFEGNFNMVDSKAYNEKMSDGSITYDVATRYPDDGSSMLSLAAYASNNWEITDKLIFSQGLRLSHVSLRSQYTQEMMDLLKFPFSSTISQDNTAFNGSLGLVVMPGAGWRFAANLSSGFRAPNVDDISKLNDSNSSDQLIIVPNPELKPEYSYNAELTIGKTIDERFKAEVTGFYTLLTNAFVARPSLYNGQDSILFDGTLSAVQSLQNAEKATIAGIEAGITARLTKILSLKSNITYTYGHVKDDDVPLDH
ncbi:MAG TPA: TonB-dependent receptor, partial [Bacteroidales bacterium]|nr:TonB-dependent receptor [Bacteroidales bacterium]